MHERLHDFLASCPDGAGSVDLLALVFRSPVSDSDFGRGFLRSLLAGDPRFEESEEGHWETVDGHLLTLACDQTPFVVVDLETTGERAGVEGITEIGAIRLEGTREVSRFETLVNPGRRIPPYVAKLTGITDGMVAEAPPIEDVIGDFYRFAAGAVIVAHNAAFDVAVLDRECVRCLNKHLGLPSLCTLKLCRRLLPDLGKASLDALADSFKLDHDTRHRAMADAELTVGVLGHLLDVFGQDHETTAGALLAFQEDPDTAGSLQINVKQSVLENLVDGRGVYRFIDGRGETLFVSRASNVREAVSRRFLDTDHSSRREREMVAATRDIDCTAAGSRLEARLVEARLVRDCQPVYNRSDKHLPRGQFVKVTMRNRFPRVFRASRIGEPGSLYVGPLRGRQLGEDAASLLAGLFGLRTCPGSLAPDSSVEPCELAPAGLCSSPCNAAVDVRAYRNKAVRLEAVLKGDGSELSRMVSAAAADSESGRHKADSRTLGRTLRLGRRYHWLVNSHNYVAAVAGSDGALLLVVVLTGRYCGQMKVTDRRSLDEAGSWVEGLARSGTRVRRGTEADSSTIMVDWVHSKSMDSEGLVVELDGADPGSSWPAVAAELEAVLS
ncbi:MAG: exonuclease domain-containing protein [Deltaproteobacteria bacterium]